MTLMKTLLFRGEFGERAKEFVSRRNHGENLPQGRRTHSGLPWRYTDRNVSATEANRQ